MENISKWIILAILIAIIILLIIFIFKTGKKLINIAIMVFVLLFCWYSFFTKEGSVRFAIVLMGHPIKAYTTGLEENKSMGTDNTRYFIPTDNISVTSGRMGYIRCETHWIVSISSYYGY